MTDLPMKESSPASRFEAKLRRIFTPDSGQDIIEWLVGEVKAIPFSPMPSGFLPNETPWLIEPLRAMANDKFRLVQIIAPIQSGKSIMSELLSCYIVARVKAPTLYVLDSKDRAENWMQTRIKKLWENCPKAKSVVGEKAIKSKSQSVDMGGTTFWVVGQEAKGNLQGKSIRWLVGDETWMWNPGHISEARSRVESFGWLGKVILLSQGSFKDDETHEVWKSTTQNEFGFTCPHCGEKQVWTYDQIRIPENAKTPAGEWDFRAIQKGTTYECKGCQHHFEDSRASRDAMNKNWVYIQSNPTAPEESQGYRWCALAARSWGKIVEQKIRADIVFNSTGDSVQQQIWLQKQMGDFWSDAPDAYEITQMVGQYRVGEDWDMELLIDPRTRRPHLNRQITGSIPARFVTVDCQNDGFFVLCRGYGPDMESRLRKWKWIDGENNWDAIEQFRKEMGVPSGFTGVDCGARYNDVIRACGKYGWTALRGDARNDFFWTIRTPQGDKTVSRNYSKAELVNMGTGTVAKHYFSNLGVKDLLARLRKMGKHTIPVDAGNDYIEQMAAEVRVMNAGKPVWKLISQKRPNHLFDCEVMQLVFAMAFGILGIQGKEVKDVPMDGSGQPPQQNS